MRIDLERIRLLVVLDALLREGSASRAAESLGVHVSAVSRLLAELRSVYDDRLFIRTGRGMTPTPFAETLRPRVRALVAEAERLLDPNAPEQIQESVPGSQGWSGRTAFAMAPLAVAPADRLEAAPTPAVIARRIAQIGDGAEPQRRLAKYIALCGPGPGRSRTLTVEEAQDAFAILLAGQADPVQIGALLMTLRQRGPTACELAGFVRASRARCAPATTTVRAPDLDWPAYISPNWRDAPWFVHSARLVAAADFRVLLHGFFGNGDDSGKLELAAKDAGIPVCYSLDDARTALQTGRIAYLPLGAYLPQLQSLFGLYPLLETRTPIHSVPHLINPLDAKVTLTGAAQLSKRDIYRDVAHLLGRRNLGIVASVRDFAQLNPVRTSMLHRIVDGEDTSLTIEGLSALRAGPPNALMSQREYWQGVWSGAAPDELAEATIVRTAAVALLSLAPDRGMLLQEALDWAAALWKRRDKRG